MAAFQTLLGLGSQQQPTTYNRYEGVKDRRDDFTVAWGHEVRNPMIHPPRDSGQVSAKWIATKFTLNSYGF